MYNKYMTIHLRDAASDEDPDEDVRARIIKPVSVIEVEPSMIGYYHEIAGNWGFIHLEGDGYQWRCQDDNQIFDYVFIRPFDVGFKSTVPHTVINWKTKEPYTT
tara:strand:+ start:2901 stop:3212 length:312 start_codon:yes stop_codon:yes gene_type:complete